MAYAYLKLQLYGGQVCRLKCLIKQVSL